MMARLNHPNIVAGISIGCESGQYFLAMEYVDGRSLAEHLVAFPRGMPERETLEYVRQVACALQHAHDRHLLHRDIKPQNILVNADGQTKLTDLGLAKALDEPLARNITQQGVALGTPHYLSPEQGQGNVRLTRATDLYALGATLFHLLTGRVPYDADTCSALVAKHLKDPVPDPRQIRHGLSAGARHVCMKLMQKRPEDRYPDAQQLADDLESLLRNKPLRLPDHDRRR